MKNFWIILSISFMLLVAKANADMRFGVSAAYTQLKQMVQRLKVAKATVLA